MIGYAAEELIGIEVVTLLLYLAVAASLDVALATIAWEWCKIAHGWTGMALAIAALAFFRFSMANEVSGSGLLSEWDPQARNLALSVLLISLAIARSPLRTKFCSTD